MTDLSKLGIGLTVAFIFSFVALVTELCYIFFRRRKRAIDEESDISSNSWSSKEIFYFFCCRNKSGIELTGAPTTVHPVDDDNVMMEQSDELEKWQELHGPSRILYTIKEEEREDLESEKSCSERKSKKRVCSIEEEKEISMVVISVESDRESKETETPYLTPCSSPPYCTPMSSPPHDRNLMYYLESENCYVLEVEKSQRRSLSEKCFPVVVKSNGRGPWFELEHFPLRMSWLNLVPTPSGVQARVLNKGPSGVQARVLNKGDTPIP
ncbi:hypothetical protein FRX31_002609 [Thalictrum thalictroides]|uniref:Transmembrane protein n=1 Tax=Thalictrum thalictroides TaxID=46969 RepID=A0A7J6XDH9_THATH|nr:hypothetical protein FRX31_002609 [Thalictrum thalictroides]